MYFCKKNISLRNVHESFFLPKTSTLNECSISPTEFDALIVYFPKCVDVTLAKTNELTDVWAFVSNLNPSLAANSFSFKYQLILALGKASTKHSNRAG